MYVAGLDRSELERKIRLLTLASLAFKNVGKNLPYSEIVDALQVDPSEVEKWVIDSKWLLKSQIIILYSVLPGF